MTLNENDKVLLADFYDSETYKVIKKVFEAKQIELGLQVLQSAQTMEYVNYNRGQSALMTWFHGELRKINKEENRLEDVATSKVS